MTDASASRLSLRGLRTASVTLLCCLGVLGSAQAQVVSTVYGNVHDSSFAAIEGATLSFFGMSGIASGLTFNTLSDRLGDYAIQLPYGCSYSVQCTASGYAVNSSFIMADSPGVLLNFQMSTASTPSDHYPVIVVQPKDACVLAGENTLLEVVATGDAPLSVFWRRNGTNLADGGNTSGSSSSILFVQGAGLLDSGQYSVVVTNSLGTVTSRLATLEVALPGIHHFTVDVVSTQNLANYPFAVAVTARDAGNNLVTDYAGTVEITGIFTTNITGRILNGSFDSGSSPSSWTGTGSSTLGYAVGTGLRGGMPTAGTRYLYMFTKDQQAVARGSYYRFTQSVDLTGAKNMTFDAGLFGAVANASEGWTYRAKAEVRIDGLAKWNETFGGLFTDQAIDVSGYSGTHTLEVRCEATRTGTYSSQWVMYDNIRLWGGSTNVPVWPARSGGFVRGVWKGTAAFTQARTNLVLRVDDGIGHVGASTAFSVVAATNPSPAILSHPQNQKVAVGGTAIFTVSALGNSPLRYCWQRDGVSLAGATQTNYTLANLQLADSGSQFSCVVSNADGVVTSRMATLVLPEGSVDHFAWAAISSPVATNAPLAVTLTALDASNHVGTHFAGRVRLSARNMVQSNMSARIQFPSFETNTLAGWSLLNSGALGGGITSSTNPGTPTDGSRWLELFTKDGRQVYRGDYISAVQGVDLTDVDALRFDAALYSPASWMHIIQAEVRIDGISRWSESGYGLHTNQTIDVSDMVGVHTIELRNEVLQTGIDVDSQWALFDNVRLTQNGYPLAMSPVESDCFQNGVWTGSITSLAGGTNVVLEADDGDGHVGYSNSLVVPGITPVVLRFDRDSRFLALSNGVFRVRAVGSGTAAVAWDVSTNLPIWQPWRTNMLTNGFLDLQVPAGTIRQQFYRLRIP